MSNAKQKSGYDEMIAQLPPTLSPEARKRAEVLIGALAYQAVAKPLVVELPVVKSATEHDESH